MRLQYFKWNITSDTRQQCFGGRGRALQTVAEIADLLEEDEREIQQICDIAVKYAPDYDTDGMVEAIFLNILFLLLP